MWKEPDAASSEESMSSTAEPEVKKARYITENKQSQKKHNHSSYILSSYSRDLGGSISPS